MERKLPKKRGAAGAIFFNIEGKILLLEPKYKDNWEIPGGIIEENESPIEACKREINEELGLNMKIEKLLCLEYQREKDDSYMFIFEGGVVTEKEIENIQMQESEIKSFGFYSLDEVKNRVLPKMYKRICISLESYQKGVSQYYETIYLV